jgi:hypothetical protein
MPRVKNRMGRDPPVAHAPASSGGSPTQDNCATRGAVSPERLQVPDSSTPASSDDDARPVTRAQRGIHQPRIYTDGTVKYSKHGDDEPVSVEDALGDTNWKHAMDLEYDDLMKNKIWHLVPQ